MGNIRLDLDRPSVTFRMGDVPSGSGWTVRWRARLERWHSVRLSNGLDLANMPGNLFITAGSIDPSEAAKEPVSEGAMFFERPGAPIGLLHYLAAQEAHAELEAEPAAFSVELKLAEEDLQALIDKTQAGFGPGAVGLRVPGLRYGHAPDGSEQHWELDDERNWRIVDGVTFWFGEETPDDEEDPGPPPAVDAPPERPEAHAVTELARVVRSVATWVISLLAAILIALVVLGR